jgi:acyl-coenzyme A synthetase/AMP-(fatty) acid ligase
MGCHEYEKGDNRMPSRSFVRSFTEWVKIQPSAPALSWGDQLVSYGELARLADSMGSAITELGPADDVPVCVSERKSPETIALVIACLKAGRRVLLPSAGLGAEALAELCVQVGCRYVLSSSGNVRVAGSVGRHLEPAELGLMLTTSGSTGLPKTVVLSPEGVDRFLSWAVTHFGIKPGSIVLNYAPLNFDLCLLEIWATLAIGACVELVEQDKAADGAYLLDLCTRRSLTVIQAVPMFYRLLADAVSEGRTFGSVEHVICTGDAMPLKLLERLPELFPQAALWNIYGCTETNDSFLHEVSVDEALVHGAVPIGRPIIGVDAVIVDESGAVVDGPGSGELLVATPFQARGYLDHRLNQEKWQGKYFRTGDTARRDENGLFFLAGRNDYHVKVRGVRTNLQEIEQVILSHSDVLEAVVVAVPHEIAGNLLHAVVRRRPDSGLNSIQLRVHSAAKLPRTAVPGVVKIIDQALPHTSTGKIDRKLVKVHRERMQLVD